MKIKYKSAKEMSVAGTGIVPVSTNEVDGSGKTTPFAFNPANKGKISKKARAHPKPPPNSELWKFTHRSLRVKSFSALKYC
jgi:hypothetical protein